MTTVHIPLFPLGTVLFPGGVLPLQIFEVRYLDMVQRCQREGTPFGVVTLQQGHEVQRRDPQGGEAYAQESFLPVGTLAHLTEVVQPQPGLLRIVCTGGERFRVLTCEKLKHGLWVAEVQTLPPDQAVPVPPELQGMGTALRQLHARLQADHPGQLAPLPPDSDVGSPWQDAGWLAHRWAELLPLPAETKQRLLTLDSPLLRLELVGDALDQLGVPH